VDSECKADPNPYKVSLGVGAYRDENGKPLVMKAVHEAKHRICELAEQEWTHEYQPIGGRPAFLAVSRSLAFGADTGARSNIASCQSLSGTGALRLGMEFLQRFSAEKTIFLPNPTWGNHKALATDSGLEVGTYTYIDTNDLTQPKLNMAAMLEDLRTKVPVGGIILLHLCAHNPTGVDPTIEQWNAIANICVEQKLQVFFDNAYQGFASGDLASDARPLQLFINKGLNVLVACSYAKIFGLYGERVGALHCCALTKEAADGISSQLKLIARAMYSNPPQFGAQIVETILQDEALTATWENELKHMSSRIKSMRSALKRNLGDGDEWKHLVEQIGMFSYTGLTPAQVQHCKEVSSVYMLNSGRISMAGLNEGNVEHVAKAMMKAIQEA
jgi:aspartate/tyrosine/aromatic aminotransferase